MQRYRLVAVVVVACVTLVCAASMGWSQAASGASQVRDVLTKDLLFVRPADRVTSPVSNDSRVVLRDQRHPMARAEYSIGRAEPDLYMGRMVMVLQPDAAQDAALRELLRAQHDPESSYYHRWLTPEEFGKRFGISA